MPRRPVDVAVDFHRMGGCGKIKNMLFMIKSKYERGTCTFNPPATGRRNGPPQRAAATGRRNGPPQRAAATGRGGETGPWGTGWPAYRPSRAADIRSAALRAPPGPAGVRGESSLVRTSSYRRCSSPGE